jgi:hypothetical protein
MIFKRKQEKPAALGSICCIKESVIEKMKESDYYKNNSVSLRCAKNNQKISKSDLSRNKPVNKIFAADLKMVYVNKETFLPGIVEIIPLSVSEDGFYSHGCMNLLKKSKTFLIPLNALSLLTDSEVKNIFEVKAAWVLDQLKNQANRLVSSNYGIPW